MSLDVRKMLIYKWLVSMRTLITVYSLYAKSDDGHKTSDVLQNILISVCNLVMILTAVEIFSSL